MGKYQGFEPHGANLFDEIIHRYTAGLRGSHHRNFGSFVLGDDRGEFGFINGVHIIGHYIKAGGSKADDQRLAPSATEVCILYDNGCLFVGRFPQAFFHEMHQRRAIESRKYRRRRPALEPSLIFFRMVVDLEVDILGLALMADVNDLEGRFGIHAGHGHGRMPSGDH